MRRTASRKRVSVFTAGSLSSRGPIGRRVSISRGFTAQRWHRVVAFSTEGTAAGESAHGEPPSPQAPVPLHRLEGVRGAGRRKPTGRGREWGDRHPVEADQSDEEMLEQRRSVNSTSCRRRSWKGARYASGRVRTSMSVEHPAVRSLGNPSTRPISLRRRRSRFRFTIVFL